MKRKEITELKQKNLKELRALLEEMTSKLIKLQMEGKTGKSKNVRAVSRTRDDLARIMTVIRGKKPEEV